MTKNADRRRSIARQARRDNRAGGRPPCGALDSKKRRCSGVLVNGACSLCAARAIVEKA